MAKKGKMKCRDSQRTFLEEARFLARTRSLLLDKRTISYSKDAHHIFLQERREAIHSSVGTYYVLTTC